MKPLSKHFARAFTLIELLVVVAIIALLISILLPSLQAAREEGKKAACLTNMRSIAQGFAGYSTEDRKDHAVPIQQQMVSNTMGAGIPGGNYWGLRTAMPFSFGGRTAQKAFPTDGGSSTVMMDDNGRWAAKTRPLNKYMYGSNSDSDSKRMPVYHCPSDSGFPRSPYVYDAPTQQCADIPVYDFTGNSYRINFAGVFFPAPNAAAAMITVAPFGHRLSTLQFTSKLTIIMEPLFYSMTIQAAVGDVPPELLLRGWHKKIMISNVGFTDGSGRTARASDLDRFNQATLTKMNFDRNNFSWEQVLRRGQSWQMDCYPTPAAWIPTFTATGQMVRRMPTGYAGWPGEAMQQNMDPPF